MQIAFVHIIRSLKMCDECIFIVEEKMKRTAAYFSKTELALWLGSVSLITVSSVVFHGGDLLSFAASLIGVTSLIFAAKGNPFAQVLMIVFSLMYGIISHGFAYYGEMVTYLGMTMPMAVISLISWLKNPSGENTSEVKVNRISRSETVFLAILTAAVTAVFYFVLRSLQTENLIVSTFSVATSFAAAYLTFRRTIYFPLAYAFNDVVLIVLWAFAAFEDIKYLSVLICFIVFLVNDLYGFISWRKMQHRQELPAV